MRDAQELFFREEEDAEAIVFRTFLSCVPLILLAVLIPVFAHVGYLKPSDEPLATWFQRSGSLTVMFAVWVEYNLSKLAPYATVTGMITTIEKDRFEKYNLPYRIVKYLGVLLAIMGTIIWGYGDLFVHNT